jgi:ferredoxin
MSEPSAASQPFPAEFLNRAGLNRQHVFDLAQLPPEVRQTLGATDGYRQLILLGHGGRQLWQCVKASGIVSEHPIDDYCRQTVARWFAKFLPDRRYRIIYPGEQAVGLQHLGKLAGWHQPSPFMVGIDAEWGSWFAYRAAILADSDFLPFFPVDRRSPCTSCASKPCIAACPAGALENGEFSLAKSVAWRKTENSPCQFTCLAREACPVGSEHRYSAEQLHHSYARSLQMLRQFY